VEGRLNLHYDEAGKAVATEFKIRSAANRKSHEIAMKTSSGNTKGEVFLVTSHDNPVDRLHHIGHEALSAHSTRSQLFFFVVIKVFVSVVRYIKVQGCDIKYAKTIEQGRV
jgi:hypothetical protein